MAEFISEEAVEEAAAIDAQDSEVIDQEDRLSKLPDDILMCILDRLDVLRDAVRTSILSRRWRHVVGLLTKITLSAADFVPPEEHSKSAFDVVVQSNMDMVKAVTSILAHKSQHTIDLLSLTFYLRDESIDIVRSVDHTMENREVVTASFAIFPEMRDMECTDHDMVVYGRRFVSFFYNYPRVFGGLKSLRVEGLRLGKSDIANILSTSMKLEYLCLDNCDCGIRSLLQIEHPRLMELKIIGCAFEKVELNRLPKLQRLTCEAWMASQNQYPLSFGYVPQLWELCLINPGSTLHKTLKLSDFLGNAIIRQLDLDFQCDRIWIQPEAPRQLSLLFQNLQTVILRNIYDECDLNWTMFFLEAAPLLKKISIRAWDHVCYLYEEDEMKEYDQLWQQILQKEQPTKWETPDGFKHYNLSALVIKGFQAEERFTRYIRHVMKAAVSLERIALYDNSSCPWCHFSPTKRYPRTEEERHTLIKQISEWRSSPIDVKIGIYMI
ncbi:hypothetical protein EJB05_39018 [Eragrostis curvula]|uniref:F-box domain-containing protein n=1 Tax=Eragrostis curvula TaxID=38414 RepID=A0A5J9TVX6_9POAL|nr:hypothetical protein EJB05_39018 [Eragrostis curvula]